MKLVGMNIILHWYEYHTAVFAVYLGEPNVTFQCVAASNAFVISWIVNNMSDSEVQDQGIATTINRTLQESNLTITSTIENNNTHIECLVFSDGSLHFIVSEAVFHVQGQLSSFHVDAHNF